MFSVGPTLKGAKMTFVVQTFAAVLTVFHCYADQLPPPTKLSYKWLNPVTVNLSWSWQKPSKLPKECKIQYEVNVLEKSKHKPTRTASKNIKCSCPREYMNIHHWTYTVQTIPQQSCNGWNTSTPMPLTVNNQRVEVVRDFKCILDTGGKNCSWIPVDPSLDLKFSYCSCSFSKGCKHLKDCDQPYSSGIRNGCFMKEDDTYENDFRFLVNSTIGMDIIKPFLVFPSPKLSITEDKGHLILSWAPLNIGQFCSWTREFCFTQCSGQQQCRNITLTNQVHRMPYDENCMYTLRSRVVASIYCPTFYSEWSEDVKYGATKPPDSTLTVAAIVIPIILFICVTLSCYCFRKHSDIICPNTPDPSAIFKEMMSGNKAHETKTERLHIVVPEAVEACKITHIMENRKMLQENF